MVRMLSIVLTVAGPIAVAALGSAPSPAHAAASCGEASAPGGDWPTYGHDLSNTRSQPNERVISPADVPFLTPAWTFSTAKAGGDGDIAGTPIVTGGCVYTATSRGWVFALNADTGAVVWKNKLPYGGGTTASVGVGPRSAAPGLPGSCAKTKAKKRTAKKRARKRAKQRARSSARKRKAKRRKLRLRALRQAIQKGRTHQDRVRIAQELREKSTRAAV